MYAVTLISWRPGFIANRLVHLLRDHGYALSGAHSIATDFAAGQAIAVQLPDRSAAERFARDAEALGIEVTSARVASMAG
jgi:hypothetical protein